MSAHEKFDHQMARKMEKGVPITNRDIMTYLDFQYPGSQHLEGEAGREAINYVRGFRRDLERVNPDRYGPFCSLFDAAVDGNIRIEQGGKPIMTGSFDEVNYEDPHAYFEMARDYIGNMIFKESQVKFNYVNINLAPQQKQQIFGSELEGAGITAIEPDHNRPNVFTGTIGNYTFEFCRRSNYWIINGNLPVAIAQSMYKNPLARRDIRGKSYEGDSFFQQFSIIDSLGNIIIADPNGDRAVRHDKALSEGSPAAMENVKFIHNFDSVPNDELFVSDFMIDTQMGLSFFVDSITRKTRGPERSKVFDFQRLLNSLRTLVSRLFPDPTIFRSEIAGV